ncbi:(2Fe-2S)-binding protein [Rhodobacteraceae bacterium CCMM004]|nr:(2Fe-2S)-binding protein [Rhodobacteraceae bacterium CCMM004]
MGEIAMTVNGKEVAAEAEDRTLLVEFLREGLGLTGTHLGCDTSQCGACLVHVDGALVKSCAMFAAEAAGREVTTIEGMAGKDGTLSPVQAAFRDQHGLQCGFCTPGMVMATAALLQEDPAPDVPRIRAYLQGNICRCTGYHNIVRAVLQASGQDPDRALAAE